MNKMGAVHVIRSKYKGRTIAKVAYCIERDKQDKIPAWREPTSCTSIYQKSETGYSFDSTSAKPNGYSQTTTPQDQMRFDGFSF